MYANPNKFIGATVAFYAKIFTDVTKDETGTYIQAYADPDQYAKNTLIRIADPNLDVKQGDIIYVSGKVGKSYSGENAFGGAISAPIITARKIEKSDYMTAFSPAKKTISLNTEQDHNGYSIKVEKIEFAEKETRVFLSVSNKMPANKINFYSFNAKLVQSTKQVPLR